LYPEVYSGGGSEKEAVGYFAKWGWYSTLDMMCDGDVLRMEAMENISVHRFHIALAHKLDKTKQEAAIRQGNNVTQL